MIGIFLHTDNDIYSKIEPLEEAESIEGFKISQHLCFELKEEVDQGGYCSGIAYEESSQKFLLFMDRENASDKNRILEICSVPNNKVECFYGSYRIFYRRLLKKHYGSAYYELRDIIHEIDPSHIAIVPDEYELEVDAILTKLKRSKNTKLLDLIIKEVFEAYLDLIKEEDVKKIVEAFGGRFGQIVSLEGYDCLDSYIEKIRKYRIL